ncbi:MAG: ABC transporter ATP-binding protein [Pseudomonadota bacterium]
MALLDIADLSVAFPTARGQFYAVDGVDLRVEPGEVVGIVGESGSGKSVSMMAVMGLLPPTAAVTAHSLTFDGRDLRSLRPRERRRIVGKDMAMIFQEPMSSLNPCFTVGFQIAEALHTHLGGSRRELAERARDLLAEVGIPDPQSRLRAFPHELSGGMSQRVMIAMAMACRPRLLIADEPTTALDVTIQAQILELILRLRDEHGMAVVLITHDMGVVAETAERVVVMYAGQQVEDRPAPSLFAAPRHPYAAALLDALPERSLGSRRLPTIQGVVPGAGDRPSGCLFHPRCNRAVDDCRERRPNLDAVDDGHVRCFLPLEPRP